jgi:hypothetical protein
MRQEIIAPLEGFRIARAHTEAVPIEPRGVRREALIAALKQKNPFQAEWNFLPA